MPAACGMRPRSQHAVLARATRRGPPAGAPTREVPHGPAGQPAAGGAGVRSARSDPPAPRSARGQRVAPPHGPQAAVAGRRPS
eukprot:scaffold152178_cov35-Tisochrysis_lutea.AAC.1